MLNGILWEFRSVSFSLEIKICSFVVPVGWLPNISTDPILHLVYFLFSVGLLVVTPDRILEFVGNRAAEMMGQSHTPELTDLIKAKHLKKISNVVL